MMSSTEILAEALSQKENQNQKKVLGCSKEETKILVSHKNIHFDIKILKLKDLFILRII